MEKIAKKQANNVINKTDIPTKNERFFYLEIHGTT